ncbi:MAG: hypothetical protein JSR67_06040 [Proteobacteria bacterium]|nr:hypothetical protein [Pseudomonadota bacterium]
MAVERAAAAVSFSACPTCLAARLIVSRPNGGDGVPAPSRIRHLRGTCSSDSIASPAPKGNPAQRYIGAATACASSSATLTVTHAPPITLAGTRQPLRSNASPLSATARPDAGKATSTCQNMIVVGEMAKDSIAAANIAMAYRRSQERR